MEKRALTVSQWCEAYNLSRTTFYVLQKEGRGPAVMRVGNKVLVTAEADEAWRKATQSATNALRGRAAA